MPQNRTSATQKLIHHLARAMVAAGVLLGLQPAGLRAEVVISNRPNNVTGGSTVSDVLWKAMLFTTGSSPTQLASVGVGLNPLTAATLPVTLQVKVSLFSVSSGAPAPATELTTTEHGQRRAPRESLKSRGGLLQIRKSSSRSIRPTQAPPSRHLALPFGNAMARAQASSAGRL